MTLTGGKQYESINDCMDDFSYDVYELRFIRQSIKK